MKASGSEIGRTIVRTIHMNAGMRARSAPPGARATRSSARSRSIGRIHEALVARDGELAASRTAAHIDVGLGGAPERQLAYVTPVAPRL